MRKYYYLFKNNGSIKLIGLIIALLILFNYIGVRFLLSNGITYRWINVESTETLQFKQVIFDDELDISIIDLDKRFIGDDPVELLQELMNFVTKVEDYDSVSLADLYEDIKSGRGLDCSGMAKVYVHILLNNGFQAKVVQLQRLHYDLFDAHVSVEVMIDGKWILIDPTFNSSFTYNNELLSVNKIRDLFLYGDYKNIKEVYYGNVNYPARLEDYYMNYLPLFNHVGYPKYTYSFFEKLPIIRYYSGPILYYQSGENEHTRPYEIYNLLYFIIVVFIPVLILITVLALLVKIIFSFFRARHDV